jgi:hypothetical protein
LADQVWRAGTQSHYQFGVVSVKKAYTPQKEKLRRPINGRP